jgi:hypothetical protein
MMSPTTTSPEIIQEDQTIWGTTRRPVGCSHCKRVFLLSEDQNSKTCPLCQHGKLSPQPAVMHPAPPELMLPFQVGKNTLSQIYDTFTREVWIRPAGFNKEALLAHTIPLFWPMWLVDTDIQGSWQIEAGYDYQVESSKEYYQGGSWQSRKQIEERIRWEPRLGTVSHHIDNTPAAALNEHENRQAMTGRYPLNQAVPFAAEKVKGALIEVPDLPPQNAWPLAKPAVDRKASMVCAKAAGADHFQNYAVHADYQHLNWTLFLLPAYATYYEDDEGQPQIVIVNGQTGAIHGPQMASRKRGLQTAGILAGIAGLFLLLTLIGLLLTAIFPPAAIIAAVLGLIGFGLGIGAIVPAVWPGQWNRKQQGPRIARSK